MRIIAVHGYLDKLRGAELTFVNMLTHLKRRGHDVDVIVFGISEHYRNQFDETGIRFTSLDFKEVSFQKPLSLLNPYLRIFNLMRAAYVYRRRSAEINQGYEIAFIHHYNYSPLALLSLKIPTVYYCHEPPRSFYESTCRKQKLFGVLSSIKNYIPRAIEKQIDRHCVKNASRVLCNSDYSRRYINRVYKINSVTNYLGVDTKRFRPLNLRKEDIIVTVGAISYLKAQDFVVKSICLIPKDKRPKLIVIGDGLQKNKDDLHSLAAEKGVSLDIRSNIPAEEVVEFYNKAKVAAIAYIMEPSIEPEALACGTPVVAVDEGGVKEAITPEVGILTRRNEEEFAHGIEWLLDNPQIAEEMGKKGVELVKRGYSWDKCAENLEKNFRKAIELRRNTR